MYSIRFKELRLENNIKQKELANILNISRSLLGRYENELEIIPIKYLNIICNIFNVSIDYIFEFTNIHNYENNNLEINKELMSKRLKEFRKNNKITQIKLAKYLNVGQSTISEYERGTNIIATPFLYMICKKYNISADYLLGKTNSIEIKK